MNHRKKSSSGLSGLAKRKRHAEEYGARPQTPKLFHYRANNGRNPPSSPSPSPLPSSPAPSTPIKHLQTPSYTMPHSPFSTPLKNGLGGGMGGGIGGGIRSEKPFTGEGITNLTIPPQNTWEKRGVMKYFTHASIAFWGIIQFLSGGKFQASEEQVRFMTRFFLLIFMIAFIGCLFYRAGTQEPLVIVQGPSNEELERNMKEAFDKLSDDYHGLAEWVVTLTKGWAKTSWKTDALLKRVEKIEQVIDNGLPEPLHPLPTPPPTPPTPPVSPPPPTPNPDWTTSEEVKEMIGEKMKEEIDSLDLESTIKGLVNDMLNARTPPPPPPSPPVDSNTPPPPSPPIDTSSFVKKEAFFAELRELQGQVTAFSRSWEELEAVKQSIKLLKGEVGERMEEMEEVRRKEEKERERKRELEKARETEERGKENAERAKEREQEKAREREEKARWEEEKRKGEEKLRGLVRGIEVLQNSLDVLETNIKTDLEKLKQANKEHQQRPPVDDLSVPVASLTSKIERLEEKITAVEETQENVKESFETVTSALEGVDLKEVKALHEVHENIEKLQDDIIRSSYLDGTGMIDWAARSLNGRVVYAEPVGLLDFSTDKIIEPNTDLGECWNMVGSEGGFIIELSNPIVPSHVSMEHNRIVPARELRTAPKKFSVWGSNQLMAKDGEKFDLLGEFTYDTNNPHPIQTFSVENEGETIYTLIKVKILSNYGGDSTCIYRFRVHGERQEFD